MIEFAHPEYLYGLSGVIALVALAWLSYYLRRKALRRFAPSRRMRQLIMPEHIGRKRLIRDLLLIASLSLLMVALARPRMLSKTSKEESLRGIELMLCIDVSNSMLSPDLPPSRIGFTKRIVSRLISERPNDRIGIVIFAANAYVQLPITSDLSTAQEFLSDVTPYMLSAQGTNIGKAIELSRSAFSDREDIGKAIIVLTDAEDHEEGGLEAATQAREAGIRVSVVGIGTSEGGAIPLPDGYLKDEEGESVITKLDPEIAQGIAEAGGGSYISSPVEAEVLKELNTTLERLPKGALGNREQSGYTEYYQTWILIAVLLLILEGFISQRRNRLWVKYNIFRHERDE